MGLRELVEQVDPLTSYIAENEGFEENIYKDTKGINTIGHGFKINDPLSKKFLPQEVLNGSRPITEQESRQVLKVRTDEAVNDAMKFMGGEENFRDKLSDNQKVALVDMAYNLGLTRLNGFKKMRKALFLGDKVSATRELLDSKYATRDVPNRAKKNADLMMQ